MGQEWTQQCFCGFLETFTREETVSLNEQAGEDFAGSGLNRMVAGGFEGYGDSWLGDGPNDRSGDRSVAKSARMVSSMYLSNDLDETQAYAMSRPSLGFLCRCDAAQIGPNQLCAYQLNAA